MLAYKSRPNSEELDLRPAVSYIQYATSSHEKTDNIIKFAQSEEGNLVENKCNTEEYESISASIDESYTDDESDYGYISINDLKDIRYESQIHPANNMRDSRLKICDHIRQTKNEWKRYKLSENSMGKS